HDFDRARCGQHHVGGFYVAVHDSHLMGVFDAFKRMAEKRHRALNGHRARTPQHAVERFAPDILHHHEEIVAVPHKAVESPDVWVIQTCERDGFDAKPLDQIRLPRQLGPQHLDCDLAFEHEVDAFEHRAHASFADHLGYLVVSDHPTNHCRLHLTLLRLV